MTDPQIAKVAALISDVRLAMLSSRDADGALVSRPLATQDADFDGDLWFFVDADSDLLGQIDADPGVNVAFAGSSSWVSVAGSASRVEDPERARELWNPMTRAWFQAEGSGEGEDPAELGAVLVRVEGSSAHYWDSPGGLATVVALVKAKLGVDSDQPGEEAVVDLG